MVLLMATEEIPNNTTTVWDGAKTLAKILLGKLPFLSTGAGFLPSTVTNAFWVRLF